MKKITFRLYQLSLFILLCWGANAWFSWSWTLAGLGRLLILSVFIIISILYAITNHVKIKITNKILAVGFLWCFAASFPEFNPGSLVVEAFRFFPLFILLCDEDNAEKHLSCLSVLLAFVLIPGIVIWGLLMTDQMPLPGIPIEMGDVGDSYFFMNYIFVLYRIEVLSERFQSIFLEPGYLGTLLVFVLYSNKFNWKKWYNYVFIIALILSQSVAGYITGVVAYLMNMRIEKRFSISKFVLSAIFLILGGMVAVTYNEGDNMFNHNIIERFDKSNKKYVGDEDIRNSSQVNNYFESSITNGDIIFGNSKYSNFEGSAGYKVYMLQWGVISAVIYLLVYLILIGRLAKSNFYGYFFLFLIVLTFIQAAYPQSYSWIIPFILGVTVDRRKKIEKKNSQRKLNFAR